MRILIPQNEVAGQPSESLTKVTFDKSVPMVTYLVCFIVCDFTYKEASPLMDFTFIINVFLLSFHY